MSRGTHIGPVFARCGRRDQRINGHFSSHPQHVSSVHDWHWPADGQTKLGHWQFQYPLQWIHYRQCLRLYPSHHSILPTLQIQAPHPEIAKKLAIMNVYNIDNRCHWLCYVQGVHLQWLKGNVLQNHNRMTISTKQRMWTTKNATKPSLQWFIIQEHGYIRKTNLLTYIST